MGLWVWDDLVTLYNGADKASDAKDALTTYNTLNSDDANSGRLTADKAKDLIGALENIITIPNPILFWEPLDGEGLIDQAIDNVDACGRKSKIDKILEDAGA